MKIDLSRLGELVKRAGLDLEGLVAIFPIGPAATEYGMKPSPEVPGPWPPKEWLPKKEKEEGAANIGAVRTQFPPAGNPMPKRKSMWTDNAVPRQGAGFWGREMAEALSAIKAAICEGH